MRKSGRICFYNMGKKESYAEMLRSPLWQKKRLEIMQRDDFTCQHCGCKERELQVHHRVYHKGAKPWEYDDSELITLCDRCHDAEIGVRACVPKRYALLRHDVKHTLRLGSPYLNGHGTPCTIETFHLSSYSSSTDSILPLISISFLSIAPSLSPSPRMRIFMSRQHSSIMVSP